MSTPATSHSPVLEQASSQHRCGLLLDWAVANTLSSPGDYPATSVLNNHANEEDYMHPVNARVEEIELPTGTLGRTVNVCVAQLRSPFWAEAYWHEMGGDKMIAVPMGDEHDAYSKMVDRIGRLLRDVADEFPDTDLLILPEYSLVRHMIEDARIDDFAQTAKAIVVGNYYSPETRTSATFVLVPNPGGEKPDYYEAAKQNPSKHDAPYLTPNDRLSDSMRRILRFWWTTATDGEAERAFLQVFTCFDFSVFCRSDLYDEEGAKIVDADNNGIIVVPSCTPAGIDEWRSRAMDRLRDAEANKKTIITIFCNSVDLPGQKGIGACGASQVVTVAERDAMETVIHGRREGLLHFTIDPFSLAFRIGPARGVNRILLNTGVRAMQGDGALAREVAPRTIGTPCMVVNPMAFERLDLATFYLMFRADDYAQLRELLGEAPIGVHGIFGVHDVLCKSFEEMGDEINDRSFTYLRLRAMGVAKERILTPYFAKVSRRWKYRGTQLYDAVDGNGFVPLFEIPTTTKIADELEAIKNVIYRGDDSERMALLEQNICIPVREGLENSDIADGEGEQGVFDHFLVFVHIGENGALYDKYILPGLMDEDKVRTIEEVSESTKGGARGYDVEMHWVLHVVGTVKDLKRVVIDLIHRKAGEHGVQVGTRVAVPAEHLASNSIPVLSERIIGSSEEREIIKKYISAFCAERYPDPFAIKRLDSAALNKLLELHRCSEKLFRDWPELAAKQARLRRRRDDFAYGVAQLLASDKDDLAREDTSADVGQFKTFCDDFFCDDMVKLVEKTCVRMSRELADTIGQDTFLAIVRAQEEISEKREGRRRKYEAKDLMGKSDLGDHIQMLSLFERALENRERLAETPEVRATIAESSCMEGIRIDSQAIENLRRLQSRKIVQMRNWFTHVEYTGDFKISNRKGIRQVLEVAIEGLDFLARYGRQGSVVDSG